MMDERAVEARLQQHFSARRAADASRTPAFAPMLEAAQREAEGPARAVAVEAARGRSARWPSRVLAITLPVLAAAGLVLMLRAGDTGADQEFEALVSEWSRVRTDVHRSPTAGLLDLPGSEYLRAMPSVGGERASSRTRNPS
jgi:hypothetical protein